MSERVALYALGLATPADAALIEADAAELAAVAALHKALADLTAALPTVAPSPAVRARLLASLAREPGGAGRFERFVAQFAAMYDLVAARAREVLGTIDDAATWSSPMPGMSFAVFRGGPAYATSDCGLLRVAPGTRFPWHAHTSDEHSLFLAGIGRDHLGVLYHPGDVLVQPAGSAHDFETVSADDLIVCVRHQGVDFAARRPA